MRWIVGKALLTLEAYWSDQCEYDLVCAYFQDSLRRHVVMTQTRWSMEPAFQEACQDVATAVQVARSLEMTVPEGLPGETSVQRQYVAPETCLVRGCLMSGAALWFEHVTTLGSDSDKLFAEAESLLRHVEVKRGRCLQPADCETSLLQRDLDRYRISVGFIRLTEKTSDLRFLNAAIKINDWAIKARRNRIPGQAAAKLLLSIALQEKAVWRIRRCEL